MKKQKLPKGWDEKKIQDLITYYENQTEDEQVAEHEAAYKKRGQTMMGVPTNLVPIIRALIFKKAKA